MHRRPLTFLGLLVEEGITTYFCIFLHHFALFGQKRMAKMRPKMAKMRPKMAKTRPKMAKHNFLERY